MATANKKPVKKTAKKATKVVKKTARKVAPKKVATKRTYNRKPKAVEVEQSVPFEAEQSPLYAEKATGPNETVKQSFAEAYGQIDVLLIEDLKPMKRIALAVMLESEGYLVESYTNYQYGAAAALINLCVLLEKTDVALKFNHANKLFKLISKDEALHEDSYSVLRSVELNFEAHAFGPFFRPADRLFVDGVEYKKA